MDILDGRAYNGFKAAHYAVIEADCDKMFSGHLHMGVSTGTGGVESNDRDDVPTCVVMEAM
jgi:hypothetical protein